MTPTTREPAQALFELAVPDAASVARAREFEAFEGLVERHEDRLYRLFVRMLCNENDAQEVVQEALLSAWKNISHFEDEAQFGSPSCRIAANTARMALRTRRRHPKTALDGAGSECPLDVHVTRGMDRSSRPDAELRSAKPCAHIQAAVDALPESVRIVFILRDVEELSTEETAALLDLLVPAVKTRLHRAWLVRREAIGRYFDAR